MATETFDRRSHWESAYASRDEVELSWFQETPEPSLRLIAESGVCPDDPLVDVGGGASRLVDALLDRGFGRVAVLDIAASALAAARARLGIRADSVAWIAADVTDWQPPHPFRLWHDRAVFHFLTDPADQRRYAAAAARGVVSGGHLVMGIFAPDGPERCSGLPVRRHDLHSLSAVFEPAFTIEHAERVTHVTPAGREQRFGFARFRRT